MLTDVGDQKLFVLDAAGMLWVHVPKRIGGWVAVLQTRPDGSRTRHFVIGIQGGNLVSIPLKGGVTHPPVLPRPLPILTPLHVPTLGDGDGAELEAQCVSVSRLAWYGTLLT
jgi:hypothetical protein